MVIAWRQVVPELLKRQADPKAIAFLSGLAKKTIGRTDLKCEPQVRDATPKFLQWYKSGIASHRQLAMIYQLALNQHTCGRHYLSAVSTLLELFELWMDGEIPSECLDLITKNGELLQQLPTAEARLLRWRFLRACSIRGYSRVDTLALASRAATFSRLFTWPGTLPTRLLALAFAIQRLDDGDSFRTIFDLAEDGNAKAVEWAELNDAGAESAGGDITIRGDGLFVKGLAITQRPEIRITANQHFVQTGWTYQRVDGGPDLRYNNNPPRGYNETVDYSLYINGREFRYASDPSQLREIIHRCSATYFDRIVPQLNRDSATAQPPDGQRRVCCPHCGTWQTA